MIKNICGMKPEDRRILYLYIHTYTYICTVYYMRSWSDAGWMRASSINNARRDLHLVAVAWSPARLNPGRGEWSFFHCKGMVMYPLFAFPWTEKQQNRTISTSETKEMCHQGNHQSTPMEAGEFESNLMRHFFVLVSCIMLSGLKSTVYTNIKYTKLKTRWP